MMNTYLKLTCLTAVVAVALFSAGCDADNGQMRPPMMMAAAEAAPAAAPNDAAAPQAPATQPEAKPEPAPQPEGQPEQKDAPPPPPQPNTDNPQTFHDFIAKGSQCIRNNDFDTAMTAFKKAAEIDPKNSYPYLGLTAIYMAKDKDQEAYAAINKAFELSPELKEGFGPLMKALYETKDPDAVWAEVEALRSKGIHLTPVMLDKVKRATGRDQATPPPPPPPAEPPAAAPAEPAAAPAEPAAAPEK